MDSGTCTRGYMKTPCGEGFGIEDSRPSIELVHRIRTSKVEGRTDYLHPVLAGEESQ